MKRFKRIYVEITSACNLSCSICPGTRREKSFMELVAFDEILGRIRPFTDYLYLHVMGEPLLHPRFPEILDVCGRHGFRVNIATNGVLIRRHKDALLESGSVRQINFSIHCLDIQRNSEIPAGYLADILEFIDEGRRKSGIYFALRLWNMKQGTVPDTGLLSGIERFFSLPQKIMDMKIEGKGIALAPRVFLNFGEEFVWPEPDSGVSEDKAFCRGLRDHCAILVDGTVVPCCLDRDAAVSLGNISSLELPEIIGSLRAEEIIRGFSEGRAVERLCRSCGFRRRFSRSLEREGSNWIV